MHRQPRERADAEARDQVSDTREHEPYTAHGRAGVGDKTEEEAIHFSERYVGHRWLSQSGASSSVSSSSEHGVHGEWVIQNQT